MSDTSDGQPGQLVDLDELRRLRGAGLILLTVQYLGGDDESDSMHKFWAVNVPRVGELISPQPDRYTRVEAVLYRPFPLPGLPAGQRHLLCPYVLVRDVPESEITG